MDQGGGEDEKKWTDSAYILEEVAKGLPNGANGEDGGGSQRKRIILGFKSGETLMWASLGKEEVLAV